MKRALHLQIEQNDLIGQMLMSQQNVTNKNEKTKPRIFKKLIWRLGCIIMLSYIVANVEKVAMLSYIVANVEKVENIKLKFCQKRYMCVDT